MFILSVCWIAVGAIVGAIAGKFVDSGDDDPKLGIVIVTVQLNLRLACSGCSPASPCKLAGRLWSVRCRDSRAIAIAHLALQPPGLTRLIVVCN